MKLNKFISVIVCGALAICANAFPVSAARIYDLNSYDTFSGRTREQVASRYAAARATITEDYYAVPYSDTAPYSGGRLNEETQQSITAMVNFYRWLVGVKDNIPVSPYREDLQAGALVRSYYFSHWVSREYMPDDMSDEFYTLGATADHNIIARGYTPQGAITGYMNEGGYYDDSGSYKFSTIGHRIAIAGSSVSRLEFGYARGVNIGDIAESSNTMDLPFATFPSAGYCPNNIVSVRSTSWSVELNTDILRCDDQSSIRVTVRDLNTGESYTCTRDNGLLSGSWTLQFAQPRTDEDRYTHSYEITITGLTDVATGGAATAKYRTDFFDYREYSDSPVISAVLEGGVTTLSISPSADLNDVAKILGDTVIVETANGRTAAIPTNGWQVDTANHVFYCSASASSLPDHMLDPNGVLSRLEIPYNVSYEGSCVVSGSANNLATTTFNEGDTCTFTLSRYWTGTTVVTLYQVPASGGTGVVRATQDSDGFVTPEGSYNSVYTMSGLTTSDSGKYLYAYRYSWDNELYITSPATIVVTDPSVNEENNEGNESNNGTGTENSSNNGGSSAEQNNTGNSNNNTSNNGSGNNGGGSGNPGGNPNYADLPSVTTEEYSLGDFIERLYTIALGRSSDPAGKQDWMDAVTYRGQTGADVARGFLFSNEFLGKNVTNEEFVRTLYRTFFDREPDMAGLNGWVNALNAGQSKQEVINGFINSTEWANLCLLYGIRNGGTGVASIQAEPNQSTIGFCTRLYTTCLNRAADQNGLMAWARQLANQCDTGTGAARGFFFSSEFTSQNVSNDEYVRRLYRTFMDREPDEAGFNAWVGQLNSGVSREEVFNGFAASTEFGEICAQYGIIR